MKRIYSLLAVGFVGLLLLATTTRTVHSKYGFVTGTPTIKSINALTFGPDGVLFIGDGRSATVFAVDTKDASLVEKPNAVDIKNIDQKIAALLGTDVKNITIQDMAVNPKSKNVYCAVQTGDGTPCFTQNRR